MNNIEDDETVKVFGFPITPAEKQRLFQVHAAGYTGEENQAVFTRQSIRKLTKCGGLSLEKVYEPNSTDTQVDMLVIGSNLKDNHQNVLVFPLIPEAEEKNIAKVLEIKGRPVWAVSTIFRTDLLDFDWPQYGTY